MERDLLSTPQKYDGSASGGMFPASPKFPDISFAPPWVARQQASSLFPREKYAIAGVALGGVAIISWFVIAVGVMASLAGIFFSLAGRNSSRAKYARLGLTLSSVGGVAALIYMFVIYAGLINYNYFTNELWGIPAGGVQTLE